MPETSCPDPPLGRNRGEPLGAGREGDEAEGEDAGEDSGSGTHGYLR